MTGDYRAVKINDGRQIEVLVLTELQFVFDRHMPDRLAVYKLLAYQKYRLNVFVVVIYFLPPPKDETIETQFYNKFMGQVTQVDFKVIKLWELDAETVLKYDNPMLIPFIPLMKGGNTEQIVRRCAARVQKEPAEVATELESILTIFAGYVMNVETLRQILRLDMHIIKDSPVFQEILAFTLEQEKQKIKVEALNQTLVIRFEVVLGQFDDQLNRLSSETLTQLNEVALRVQSLSEFEDELATCLAQVAEETDSADILEPV